MRCLVALWVVMVVGCGEVKPTTGDGGITSDDGAPNDGDIDAPVAPPGEYLMSIDPASLTIPIAGSDTIDITISRTDHTLPITLTAVNVPSGVTVTFEPATLPAGTNASVATVQIAGGIAVGNGNFTIDATDGALMKSATVSVSWTTITVSGTVQNGASGVKVGMPGRTTITTTTGGAFTFTNVTPPYDLYTVSDGGLFPVYRYVYYYKGLTRSDPVVTYAAPLIAFFASNAGLTGSISGHPGYANTFVGWGDNAGTAVNVSTTNYSMLNATWEQGLANKAGNLHALSWSTKGSGQTDQVYYGSTAATLSASNANDPETVNITLAQASTATLTGTIAVPSGFATPTLKVFQNVGFIGTLICNASGTSVNTTIPIIGAGKSTFSASSSGAGGSSAMSWPDLNANTDVSFTLLDPPTLAAPANAATGVTTTTDFAFTAPANHVHVFYASTGGTTKAAYTVYTTATTVRLPNVSESPLPANQAFNWSVGSYGTNTHVNAAATATGLLYPGEGLPSGPRRTYTGSPSRSFTSQ